MKDFIQCIAYILGVILLGAAVTHLGFKFINERNQESCYAKWSDSKWDKSTGCMVNVNGDYIPEDNVHVIKWEYVE